MRSKPLDLLVGIPVLIAVLVLGALLIQPGCSASQCHQPAHATGPTPTIECPSGQVCYEGQCRRSCNAGAELSMSCQTEGDCNNASLPFCTSAPNGLFCSSCGGNEVCVPELNICQPVSEFTAGDGGMPPPLGMIPAGPLDSGAIDGYSLTRDAEPIAPPSFVDLTHVGTIELAQVTDFRADPGATAQALVTVSFLNIEGVHPKTQPIRIGDYVNGCELDYLRTFTSTGPQPKPANLGDITFDTDKTSAKPALATSIVAKYDMTMGAYTFMPVNIPNPILELSVPVADPLKPNDDHFASVVSSGFTMTAGPWPVPQIPFHIPYALDSPQTIPRLKTQIQIQPTPQDLVFTWTLVKPKGGGFGSEVVSAEIRGNQYRVACETDESLDTAVGSMTMTSALIQKFIDLEGIRTSSTSSGFIAPLTFERVDKLVPNVPGTSYMIGTSSTGMTEIEIQLRFSHKFIGQVRF
jgi:hypothetical protein